MEYTYAPDDLHIEVLNFWKSQRKEDVWLYQFVVHHCADYLTKSNSLLLSSVFGPRRAIDKSKSKVKLFYTGENVRRFHEYRDYCLSSVDISLGFDYIDATNYLRFPIWLFYFFAVDFHQRDIQVVLDNFYQPGSSAKDKFCAMVCSHDKNGIRSRLYHALSEIEQVDSAGSFMPNTNELKSKFNNDKISFLKQYKFNICPENTNHDGYVTEKLFEAIRAGTVPIYWGAKGQPEPDVLNHDAIVRWDDKFSVKKVMRIVEDLHSSKKRYQEFTAQPKFKDTAAEYIADRFSRLRNLLIEKFEHH
ncbi:glycosyltransferase family 10 domain-containing protein [Olivibacter sitiensis]|uniref:glycosyltransferase family 10 domain-containing protein n=1 Tax=Olivibacter sitiensis TaxID=376470 RepID=UPI00146FB1C9|nr:glycosyltransferase family 10 [Olivibacter sitiensis]